MNTNIKNKIINILGAIVSIAVVFFFFTYWLYLHNGIEDDLEKSWSALVSFCSFLGTMGAAVIAANLFNDWREQKRYEYRKEIIHDIISALTRQHLEIIKVNGNISWLKETNNFVIIINDKSFFKKLFYSQDFSSIYANLKLYENLYNIDLSDIFRKYEHYFIALNTINGWFIECYEKYYSNIPATYKNSSIGSGNYSVKIDRFPNIHVKDIVSEIQELFSNKHDITYITNIIKLPTNETYEQIQKKLLLEYENFFKQLVVQIII